ncbi:MAG: Nif3-like dinuclear metal center hexameric protein, partial [Clostridia bacterium]|nr:Nif3-like dinuclear metal center hexameric protein [Clostridia bacterium]
MQVKELLNILNGIAPFESAEKYDNVGLLVGSKEKEIKSALLALDLTERVLDEAIEKQADAVITHHPLLFHPVKRIDTEVTEGKILSKLI